MSLFELCRERPPFEKQSWMYAASCTVVTHMEDVSCACAGNATSCSVVTHIENVYCACAGNAAWSWVAYITEKHWEQRAFCCIRKLFGQQSVTPVTLYQCMTA